MAFVRGHLGRSEGYLRVFESKCPSDWPNKRGILANRGAPGPIRLAHDLINDAVWLNGGTFVLTEGADPGPDQSLSNTWHELSQRGIWPEPRGI